MPNMADSWRYLCHVPGTHTRVANTLLLFCWRRTWWWLSFHLPSYTPTRLTSPCCHHICHLVQEIGTANGQNCHVYGISPVSHRGRTASPSGQSLTLLMGYLDHPPRTQWDHSVRHSFLLGFSLWTVPPQLLGKHAWAHVTHTYVTWIQWLSTHDQSEVFQTPQTSDQCIHNTSVYISKRQDFWKM